MTRDYTWLFTWFWLIDWFSHGKAFSTAGDLPGTVPWMCKVTVELNYKIEMTIHCQITRKTELFLRSCPMDVSTTGVIYPGFFQNLEMTVASFRPWSFDENSVRYWSSSAQVLKFSSRFNFQNHSVFDNESTAQFIAIPTWRLCPLSCFWSLN